MEIDNTIIGVQLIHYAEGDKSVPGHVEFYSRHGCIGKVPVQQALAAPAMLAALAPFAAFAEHALEHPRRGLSAELYGWDNAVFIRMSDLQAARAAILKAKGGP